MHVLTRIHAPPSLANTLKTVTQAAGPVAQRCGATATSLRLVHSPDMLHGTKSHIVYAVLSCRMWTNMAANMLPIYLLVLLALPMPAASCMAVVQEHGDSSAASSPPQDRVIRPQAWRSQSLVFTCV